MDSDTQRYDGFIEDREREEVEKEGRKKRKSYSTVMRNEY